MFLKQVIAGVGIALVCAASVAEPISLRCISRDSSGGNRYESQIVVDPATNMMRVDGEARPLEMTDDYYATDKNGVLPGFVVVTHIDRRTGAITTTELFHSEVRRSMTGICEKAPAPPPRKF